MMDRRAFITMVGGSFLAAPLVVEAQPAGKVSRIGFLFFGAPGPSAEVDAFRQGLRELGYIEGQNATIEYRFAGGQVERLPELASELARLKVDVIVASNTPSAMAAKAATSTIPIVFAVVADAVGAGLISNFARPGGNITGLTSISSELSGKRLELLKEVAANASRLAVLYNPSDRSNVLMLKELQESARVLGLIVHPLEVRAPGDFGGAFAAMSRERDSVLFVAAGVLTLEHRNRKALVDLATKSRIPAMWGHRQFVEAGGLMSYAVNFYDQLRRAAIYVDKILKGAKPGDLPVEQPTRYELIINLKTAKALGLTIPQSLLVRADEVIQ
jgi:putative tryptophan/tyrosine transport system substrate-binding protein